MSEHKVILIGGPANGRLVSYDSSMYWLVVMERRKPDYSINHAELTVDSLAADRHRYIPWKTRDGIYFLRHADTSPGDLDEYLSEFTKVWEFIKAPLIEEIKRMKEFLK